MPKAPRFTLSVSALSALLAFASCAEQAAEPKSPHKGQQSHSAPAALWLAEPELGEDGLFVPLRSGVGLPGLEVRSLAGVRLDTAPARLGGEEWQTTLVQGAQGQLGLRAAMGDRRGSFLIGFMSEPQLVRTQSVAGSEGELLRVQHHAKLCVHVRRSAWDQATPSPALAARFGWRLELVPMSDPLPLARGEEMLVRVRFDGPGLEGCECVAWLHGDGTTEAREVFRGKSGRQGIFELPLRHHGLWRIVARHRVAADGERPAELHIASLVFRTGGGR